jgi:hypothetical protein
MRWHRNADANNSMLDMGLHDVVQRGLDGTPTLPVVPSPWGRQPRRRRTRRQPDAVPISQDKTPTATQSLLPTDAVGNAPEGTGRMGLA